MARVRIDPDRTLGHPEAGKLYVSLVNLRRDAEETVQLELTDVRVGAEGILHLVTGPSPEAKNTFAAPCTVGMKHLRLDKVGSRSTVVLPPHSTGVLELTLA